MRLYLYKDLIFCFMPKRISRQTPPEVREKISEALRRYHAENPASEVTRARISAAMRAYWETIPTEAPDAEHAYKVEEKI